MTTEVQWTTQLEAAYTVLLNYLARNNDLTAAECANLEHTPARAARAWIERHHSAATIDNAIRAIIATGFPTEDAAHLHSMVTLTGIRISSTCPHHFMPVLYEAHVSYIPKIGGTLLGLSKLARLCDALSHRPVLHEQLARDIADVLHKDANNLAYDSRWPQIASEGSAVTLIGRHTCMACRGVQSDALTTVTELRGRFWESGMETKFYAAVNNAQSSKL